jgi:hypothetical protein
MSNTWILFYVFLMFVAGAVCTYSKALKDHWIFYVVMIGTALAGSYAWVVASRRLDKVADLMWFSLLWDILMVIAYYAIPFFFYEHKLNWQAWCAMILIIVGILWFKMESGV